MNLACLESNLGPEPRLFGACLRQARCVSLPAYLSCSQRGWKVYLLQRQGTAGLGTQWGVSVYGGLWDVFILRNDDGDVFS